MTKVLLTGASGYIGKHIALELLNQGYHVRASVRSITKSQEVIDAVKPHLADSSDLNDRLTFVELDLEKDSGWDEALIGADVLMHTASPFPIASPKDENDVIRPAVDGTLRALNSAKKAGITRVILTSSNAAIYGTNLPSGKTEFDETMWTDVNHPVGKVAYTKSKTLAEQAAWKFIQEQGPEIRMTTINPVLVLGAPLDKHFGSSLSVIERLMKGSDPMAPDIQFSIVNVRDVAKLHVNAIKISGAENERFLATSETRSFVDMAKFLKSNYPKSKVKTGLAPDLLIRFLAIFDADIRAVLPLLGKTIIHSGAKASAVLAMKFTPIDETIKESADYLIKNGFVRG